MAPEYKQVIVRFPIDEYEKMVEVAETHDGGVPHTVLIRKVVAHACGAAELFEANEANKQNARRLHTAKMTEARWDGHVAAGKAPEKAARKK